MASSDWLKRKEEAYVAEHGSMPLCECKCGEHVKMNSCGRPQRFAGRNHQSRVNDMAALSREGKELAAIEAGDIPVGKFRDVIVRLKSEKGLTWAQLSEMGGTHPSTLRSRIFDHRKKWVTRRWATDFLRSFTEADKRRLEEEDRRQRHRETVLDRMYGP